LRKRYDAVVFNLNGIEVLRMQSTQSKDTQATFDQIARYNMTMNEILMVTNGLNHYFARWILKTKSMFF
jgi:hypothetical protein